VLDAQRTDAADHAVDAIRQIRQERGLQDVVVQYFLSSSAQVWGN
jgi:hypothetical protein